MGSGMEVFDTPAAMRAWARRQHASGHRIAVVPTMGALHGGHLALVAEARQHADRVVVTIFVNPLQFNQPTDFDAYPRPIDDDLVACAGAGVDAVYAPTSATMYPPEFQTRVVPGELAHRLEGPMRPGHFEGVTTVVSKLFAATRADVAVFGEKDFQQLAIVRRMAADLDLGVEIVGLATVREPDGLARSSRNVRLTAADRAAAAVIPHALRTACEAFTGGLRQPEPLATLAREAIAGEPRASVEYVEVVDADTLSPAIVCDATSRILAAAWFGDVRLIDNCALGHRWPTSS